MKNKFDYAKASLADFENAMDKYGWLIYENVVSDEIIDEIINDVALAYDSRRKIQLKNGIGGPTAGVLHHLVEKDNFSFNFLEQKYFDREIKHFLKGNYIINGFSVIINSKTASTYVQNIHRDIRTYSGEYKIVIQGIFLLDDFTADNGATVFLSGSHKIKDRPDDQYFYKNAVPAIAKKGSAILFDANVYHAGGINQTDNLRRILTYCISKPFFKQQFDIPRYLGYQYGETLSDHLRQVLGYKSRTSENLEEYYQPPHLRMYQPDQE